MTCLVIFTSWHMNIFRVNIASSQWFVVDARTFDGSGSAWISTGKGGQAVYSV